MNSPIVIATRGSALALAQARAVLSQCQEAFPLLTFEVRIIKTTGDKLQTASLAGTPGSLPKGLFTKELEVALEKGEADLAVHSLKDLPTELPPGLRLGAVGRRADVRDVLIRRASTNSGVLATTTGIAELPPNATVATSSNRRKAQLLSHRPDLRVVEIRGNVGTRLQKLVDQTQLDAIVLAAAGLERLNIAITANGELKGESIPNGLLATLLEPEVMLPCVGQGALGIEVSADNERVAAVCQQLDHRETHRCIAAERAFLSAMGGGCQSPIAAYADATGDRIRLRGLSYQDDKVRRGEMHAGFDEAESLGRRLAVQLQGR